MYPIDFEKVLGGGPGQAGGWARQNGSVGIWSQPQAFMGIASWACHMALNIIDVPSHAFVM